jgi:hypothetical protein
VLTDELESNSGSPTNSGATVVEVVVLDVVGGASVDDSTETGGTVSTEVSLSPPHDVSSPRAHIAKGAIVP